MKHISSRIALYSFLYLVFLFVIFFLQFKKGTSFSYARTHLSVQGRFFVNEKKEKELLFPLHITSNGLVIFITQEEAIKAMMQDGSIRDIKMLSYQTKDNGLTLFCDNAVKIDFITNNRTIPERSEPIDSLHIACHFNEDIKEIYLPYKLTQNARPVKAGSDTMVQYQNKTYAFSKTQGMGSAQTREVSVIAFSENSPSIYYAEHLTKLKLNLEDILTSNMASKDLYEKNLNRFSQISLDELEKQVNENRHNAKTMVAIFSEYARRGEYERALVKYPASRLARAEHSYLTLPFYGNVIESYNKKLLSDSTVLQTIQNKLENRDVSIFDIPNIFSFLNDRGEASLLSTLIEFLENIGETMDEKTLSPYQLANILDLYLEYKKTYEAKDDLDSLIKRIEASILDFLFELEERLYIQTREGEIESLPTFSISSSLIRYGTAQKNELLCSVGYFLFNSLYSFTDEPTSFPSSFKIKEDEGKKKGLMAMDKDILGVEEIYPIVFYDNAWYTHEKSVLHDEEKNIFALTACTDIKVANKDQNILSLEFSFLRGFSHYVVLEGIDVFESVQIGSESNYKTDPRFEIYTASGYVYSKEKKIFYLKLRHNTEKVRINFFY